MNDQRYPQHTPKLAELLAAMLAANTALQVIVDRLRYSRATVNNVAPGSIANLPEYQNALVAYRAYWAEVDADRAQNKAACHPANPNC